jgi:hypothetical protein
MIAYILFSVLLFSMILGAALGIWGLIAVKFWDHFTVEPDFTENLNDEDQILAEWAKAYMKREDRKIGFYYVYQWDLKETWHKIWYFQFMKYFKINIFKYRTQKGKHIIDD